MFFFLQKLNILRSSGKGGFSLIEVMVGFAVFSLSMIAIMGVVTMSQSIGESARNRIEALQDARGVMEFLKGQTYTSNLLAVGTYTVEVEFNTPNWEYVIKDSSDNTLIIFTRQTAGYAGEYTVSEVTGFSGELKQIIVTIDYNSFGATDELELVMEKSRALN